MSQRTRTGAIIDVLAGRATVTEVARTFDVTEEEVALWKALYLDGAAGAVARPRGRAALRLATLTLGMVLASSVGFVGYARSQSTCAQTLPAPLVTFCAGEPARAAQVNGNFQQIVDWIVAKVGAVDASGVTASQITSGAYTPSYRAWEDQVTGAGGAAIYNDGSDYKALMVVGNSSAGGNRRVGLWDDVEVSGGLTVGGNLAVRGGLAVDGTVSGGLAVDGNITGSGAVAVNGNVSSSNNAWDGNHYTGGTAIAQASEPTGSGWARGRQAYNNIQSYMCGNGEYVCGIEFWHGYNWSWYDEATRVRCCKL